MAKQLENSIQTTFCDLVKFAWPTQIWSRLNDWQLRSGRPIEISTPSLEARTDDIIRADRHVTVEIIAQKKRKLTSLSLQRWIPRELARLHMDTMLRMFTKLKEQSE